jgi:tetratricopeptide (TPR) repeat protein
MDVSDIFFLLPPAPLERNDAYRRGPGRYTPALSILNTLCTLTDVDHLSAFLVRRAGEVWGTRSPERANYGPSFVERPLYGLLPSLSELELLRGLEDPQAEAYMLSSLAESHLGLGHRPSALSCLKRSLRLRSKVGDIEGEVGVLYDLAKVYEDLGDTDLARKAREEAVSKEGKSGEAREAVSTVERKNY